MLSPAPEPVNLYSGATDVAQDKTTDQFPVVNQAINQWTPLVRQTSPSLSENIWWVFAAAAFLVSVPVFFEAPLVRYLPWLSVGLSTALGGFSLLLRRRKRTAIWGDLLVGFTWTWLCGAIFWGWWRWEPTLHIPFEAVALPIALWGLRRGWATVGQAFYLGSLLGTVITDIYFYVVNLMPAWKQLMRSEPSQAGAIFQAALTQMYLPWGMAWTAILLTALLFFGWWGLMQRSAPWMAFSGAVLSTILVDGLFWLAAALA